MSYSLDRSKLRHLIEKEIKRIGEDALVKRTDNTLGGSRTMAINLDRYDNSPMYTMSMDDEYMEEDSCSEEEDALVSEGSCGCSSTCGCKRGSNYPVPMENELDSAANDVDFKEMLIGILGLGSDVATPGEAVGIGYNIGKHHHSGAYMAKSQMYKVSKYAEKLYHMIPDGHNLEDWMRTKLAQISDDISEVYHALEHDIYEGDL